MVGASKILTVSYGTFSCTLEGFDEPFNTMKAIAEYFRDLAADDRYFGAEPPTPDAAMLHQIAEREMKRRVEAKIQDNGVILRATDSRNDAPPSRNTPATLAAPAAVVSGQPTARTAPDALFEDQHASAAQPNPAASTENAISDSVAAKLSRIRNAMSDTRASGETTRPAASITAAFAAADAQDDSEAEALAQAKALAEEKAKAEAKALADAETEQAKAESEAKAAEAKARADAEAEQAKAAAKAKAEAAAKTAADAKAAAEAEAEENLDGSDDALTDDEMLASLADAFVAEGKAQSLLDAVENKARADAEAEQANAAAQENVEDSGDASSGDKMLSSLAGAFDDEDLAGDARFDDETSEETPELTPDAEGEDTLMASVAAAMAASSADQTPMPAPERPADIDAEEAIALFESDEETEAAEAADLDLADDVDDLDDDLDSELDDDLDDDDFADLDLLDQPEQDAPKATTDLSDSAAASKPAAAKATETASNSPPADATPTAAAEQGQPQGQPQVNPTLQRARARVIKIRRADPAAGEAAQTPAATETTIDRNAARSSALSAEAEADLMRELADVQADAPDAKPAPAAEPESGSVAPVRPQRPVSPRRRPDDLSPSDEDASVKRLLDQTNSELQGTENRRRLSAISHLKAAVAATVADRKSGGNQGPTEEMRMTPYRSDLERAVRTGAGTASATTSNVAGDRPAPLMLVSEQRIDTPRQKPSAAQTHITPVRPHRVSSDAVVATTLAAKSPSLTDDEDEDHDLNAALDGSDAGNIFGPTTSFADYAEKLGAESLTDVLEAAVAFAAHVEGRPDVSRPEMVKHVLSVQPELENDRESILRSFGTLLRDGRIEKVRRGYFALSETSPIQAEARKAAMG